MFRWISKSRLRIALAIIFFCLLFGISIPLLFYAADADGALARSPQSFVPFAGMITALVSLVGTISTVTLAWRADRRTAKESDLKLIQLQQQIAELQMKLTSKLDPDGKVA